MKLERNHPNPLNPTTQIAYELPSAEFVSLRVYNSLAQLVAALVNEQRSAAAYAATFRATDLLSGIYFYRLVTGQFQQTQTLLLLKLAQSLGLGAIGSPFHFLTEKSEEAIP